MPVSYDVVSVFTPDVVSVTGDTEVSAADVPVPVVPCHGVVSVNCILVAVSGVIVAPEVAVSVA